MKEVIIIGPPGSGKDTQIEELRRLFDFQVISGGDIVRALAEKNKKIREIMDAGGLIDDEVVLAHVDELLGDIPHNTGIVFDGFPRTMHQAERINEILMHHDRVLDAAIYLHLEEEDIVERLTKRRVCSMCGKNIPIGAEKCECGGRPIRREDDEPATIINRVQTFLDKTLPLINYYQNKGILVEINGNQTIQKVAEDIKEKLANVEER